MLVIEHRYEVVRNAGQRPNGSRLTCGALGLFVTNGILLRPAGAASFKRMLGSPSQGVPSRLVLHRPLRIPRNLPEMPIQVLEVT
jgi:hypothetical protein